MAMDVLQSAALNSLLREVLPKLQEHLAVLSMVLPEERKIDPHTSYFIKEASQLLSMLSQWSIASAQKNNEDPKSSLNTDHNDMEEIGDEEAQAMLRMMDDPDQKVAANPPSTDENDREMSDEEARAMLNLMDAPFYASKKDPSSDHVDDKELSDEEARAMLGLTDNSAVAGTKKISSEDGQNEEMSDEEARALLGMMDEPSSSPKNLEKSQALDHESMSDAEARAMLNLMDAPLAPPTSVAPSEEIDDDEARRLLAMMDSPAEKSTPLAVPEDKGAAKVKPEIEVEIEVEDVPEWIENEFSNDQDMIRDFITNTDDLMETLDRTILALENDPSDKETIEEIFRAAHTLKGAAGMFGYSGIEAVMHKMENLFDLIRKGKMHASSEIIDVVFQGLDTLRILLTAVKSQTKSGHDIKPIVRALINVAEGRKANLAEKGAASKNTPPNTAPVDAGDATLTKIMSALSGSEVKAEDSKKVEMPQVKSADITKPGVKAKKQESQKDNTIRVDLERLDHLVSLVGELVTDRTRFSVVEEDLRSHFSQLSLTADMTETVQLFSRHMNEVQDIIMKIRMVPIGNEFNKFPRVVRDLARQLSKKIDLKITGEDTELDKTLVEQIGDPLIHLIRNACDHGVETPEVRVASGKSEGGVINLAARQEGNNIVITIQDDGKGMDPQKLKQKAIEKGLISPTQNLSDSEIFNLIFEAGFSTAEKITNVSGRGVGMDVVRKQISKLKGTIAVDSTLGKGSVITISLPLTLAIVQSLLIKCRDEIYAIPLSSVIESIRISPKDIQRVGDMPVVKRMGKVLPLVDLSNTLELSRKKTDFWYDNVPRGKEAARRRKDRQAERIRERLFVVVVGTGEKRFGIIVDSLMNQQEMVIKPMGSLLKEMPCIAGGAVLGTGQVVLVLDVGDLESYVRNLQRTVAA